MIAYCFSCQRYRHAGLTWREIPYRRPIVKDDVVRHEIVVRPHKRVANDGLQGIRRERAAAERADNRDRQLNGKWRAVAGRLLRRRSRTCSRVRRWTRLGILITIAIVIDAARCKVPNCRSHVSGRAR